MNVDAVLVSFTLEGHAGTYETSGILFKSNLVLLTGTALIPLVQQEKWISQFVSSSSSKLLRSNTFIQKISFRVYAEREKIGGNCVSSTQLYSFDGKPVGVWKCPLVSQSTKRLFCDWAVGHVSVENKSQDLSSDDIDLFKELMSIFILLECKGRGNSKQSEETNKSEDDVMRVLPNFLGSLVNADRGQEVEVVSTPFGHRHFMNSLSRGIICNAVGCEKCIILSDARTVSGCEGGPIFVTKRSRNELEKGKLIGMVTCPLSWWRGEWVGLTMGISLLPVLKKLLRPEEDIIPSIRSTPDSFNSDSKQFKFIDESVVLVRSKDSWGSGVVLQSTSGIVLTCSHVVKDDDVVSVFHKNNQCLADVIFKSHDEVAFDLAVIKVRQKLGCMKEVKIAEKRAKLDSRKKKVQSYTVLVLSEDHRLGRAVYLFHNFSKVYIWRNPPYSEAFYKFQNHKSDFSYTKNCAESPEKGVYRFFFSGERVIAAGFPFFSERDDVYVRPTIVTGCISRVNSYMIQTTCCVQSGFSGGPLFRNGELLGIIVSNAVGSGALFPHINFIIPSSVFKEPVLKYIRTNDIQSLEDLESSSVQVQSLWKLHTSKL